MTYRHPHTPKSLRPALGRAKLKTQTQTKIQPQYQYEYEYQNNSGSGRFAIAGRPLFYRMVSDGKVRV